MADAKRIQIIEDDREIADLVAEELTDRGYEVRTAYSGQEGCSAIFETAPDLVLSDLMMPVMSGFDVLKQLAAASPTFRNIPFVFLSGQSEREVALRARLAGADDFVVKPVDFDVLDRIISTRLALAALQMENADLVDRRPQRAVD
jgi:DNA-binding response OmpR family regulator